MENVKGFETSRAREILIEMLENNEFNYQEYLLCPKQLGIPNARLRYYLIATKSSSLKTKQLVSDMKNIDQEFVNYFLQKDGSCGLKSFINIDDDPFDKEKLKLTSKILKHAQVFDIVDINSNNSCCFTKSYGKYAKGTGNQYLFSTYRKREKLFCVFFFMCERSTNKQFNFLLISL